jgi:hypothetical protein
MTRVVGPHNEQEFVTFALQTTTARVEERCRELRCGQADSIGIANRAFANRSLRVHRNAEKGAMTFTVELPTEVGEVLEKALDKARDDSQTGAEFVDESWSARQADALIEVAKEKLMLLCERHHRLVHEGGFAIERDDQNRWFFKRTDGRVVPNCGYNRMDMTDDYVHEFSELFKKPPAGGLLTAVEISSLGALSP